MVLRRQHDIGWPSQRHRISIVFEKSRTRWHQDGNTILTKTVIILPRITWTYKTKTISTHTTFSQKPQVEYCTFKSWRISMKKKNNSEKEGTSRQRPGKGAIRKRFPLQKPRWEKTKLTIRYLYHETYRKPNEQLFSQQVAIQLP